MISNEPIILEIGIEICLTCPYDDCIETDTDLCHLMKDEVRRVKNEARAKQDRIDQEMVSNILHSVQNGPLTIPELRDIYGYEYDEIDRLIRHDKLKSKKTKENRRTQIFVTG